MQLLPSLIILISLTDNLQANLVSHQTMLHSAIDTQEGYLNFLVLLRILQLLCQLILLLVVQ
jgi:hypothetical protein